MAKPVMLNCKSTGDERNENLVILHGLFGDLANWRAQADKLSTQYLVHSMDLRNHGGSPHASGMSYPEMADDVAYTCDALQINNTSVLGHSMGGKTAMQLAGYRPDLVDRLIVVDIAPRKYPHHHTEIIKGLQHLHQTSLASRKDAAEQLSAYVSDPGIRAFLLKNVNRASDGTYQLRVNIDEIADKYDDIADAISSNATFDKPVLFIKGADSNYLTEADRSDISVLFNNVSLKTIDGAGHWPHSEKPDVVYKVVSDFLAAGARNPRA